jgi:hypothetical protein
LWSWEEATRWLEHPIWDALQSNISVIELNRLLLNKLPVMVVNALFVWPATDPRFTRRRNISDQVQDLIDLGNEQAYMCLLILFYEAKTTASPDVVFVQFGLQVLDPVANDSPVLSYIRAPLMQLVRGKHDDTMTEEAIATELRDIREGIAIMESSSKPKKSKYRAAYDADLKRLKELLARLEQEI